MKKEEEKRVQILEPVCCVIFEFIRLVAVQGAKTW